MDELERFLTENVDQDLVSIVISGARAKEGIRKVKIRPVAMRDSIVFQAALEDGRQVFHENITQNQIVLRIMAWLKADFRQLQLESKRIIGNVLVSKKGQVSVKSKRQNIEKVVDLSHNRKKKYILEEGIKVPFLIDLGVMTQEGKIVRSRYDKFRQINRFLEFIEDILPHLPKGREVTILDFGCGKSYLTFAMYYYLKLIKAYDIRIVGLDLKADVIAECNQLSEKYGYDKLHFYVGDIASYSSGGKVDMVVSLHACDTASDYALAKAVTYDAEVILCVPCCQHELNGQIAAETLQPVLKYGLLKERLAALMTDGLRAEFLATKGYSVQILEFIEMTHTPKNILIRAVKGTRSGNERNSDELSACLEYLHVQPTLEKLLDYQR